MAKKILIGSALVLVAVVAVVYVLVRSKPVLDDAARADATGSFVRLIDGVVHYEMRGDSGAPPVVLIHGASVPMATWDHTFGPLADAGFRVIRYDLYGRGFSDRPRIAYTYGLYMRQLQGLLDSLRVAGPVHVVGLSMGGGLAGLYAGTYPERVKSLVLVDPAGPYLHQVPRTERLGVLGRRLSRVFKKVPPHVKEREEKLRPLLKKVREQFRYRGTEWATYSFVKNRDPSKQTDAFENVGRRKIPCLVIWGEEDPVLPAKFAQDIKGYIPRARVHLIARGGHVPQYEQPEVVNPILIDFLREVSADSSRAAQP